MAPASPGQLRLPGTPRALPAAVRPRWVAYRAAGWTAAGLGRRLGSLTGRTRSYEVMALLGESMR